MRRIYLFFFLLFLSAAAHADSLQVIKTIPVHGRTMTVDELGNVYVVRNDNCLIRFTENGDSSAFYRSLSNGDIGAVDATNPLQLLLYYPDYAKAEILDRMLALKNEIDLLQLNTPKPAAIATSADGNLWIYDQFNAVIRKIDDQLNEVGRSNDLRQQTQSVPSPSYMTERERKLYVCDTAQGILVFDQYGSYINTISVFNVKYLQVFGPQLVYRHNDSLISFNLQDVRSNVLFLPGSTTEIKQAAIGRNAVYVLYADKLVLYRLPEDRAKAYNK
ncbi:hypothetical protein ACTHGU_05650 [Chitinophagaceae bacterium MMS25-I14]